MNIIIDKLELEDCTREDIVTIEEDNVVSDKLYILLSDKDYCTLDELCFYIYENKSKPKSYKLKSTMIFYKIGTLDELLLKQYDEKVGDKF